MAQKAKADRSAAGKKAAATRERNKQRSESQERGGRAAASRQANKAKKDAEAAKKDAEAAKKAAEEAAKKAEQQKAKEKDTKRQSSIELDPGPAPDVAARLKAAEAAYAAEVAKKSTQQ